MMRFTKGNLLDAEVEALVNTVNTVGVMGKGIALMFKERFPENYELYHAACKSDEVRVGRMFVTETSELSGPRWIINFPTKQHWRRKTKLEWVTEGLKDLRRVIEERGISSIAIPPLGCGNGGLDWQDVRPYIENSLADLPDVDVVVYEPTSKYQNVAKKKGVDKLTPARALIAELVRRYWVLGIECTILEVQKLAWFMQRNLEVCGPDNPLGLDFEANKYGPYSDSLRHLLDSLDGSYLRCDKRLADASPYDTIWFEDAKREKIRLYLDSTEAHQYLEALEFTDRVIDGFQTPLGMELLATVDWLILRGGCSPTLNDIKAGLRTWPGGQAAGRRKERLFNDRMLNLAIARLDSLYAT